MTEERAPRGASAGVRRHPWRSWLRHHQRSARSSMQQLLQYPLGSLMTLLVLGLALAMPAAAWVLLGNIDRVTAGLETGSRMTVFLDRDTSPEALYARLQQDTRFLAVELIDRDAALQEFQSLSGWEDALQLLPENPLPDVLVLSPLLVDTSLLQLKALASEIEAMPGVDVVQVDSQWLERLQAIYQLLQRGIWALIVAFGLGMVLTIGNTIRLAIENHRDEINVVRLVGGTDAFVRRPFLYTGLWYGLGSGLLAWLLVALAVSGLVGPADRLAALYFSAFQLRGPGLTEVFVLLGAGGLVGVGGAYLAVQRHIHEVES